MKYLKFLLLCGILLLPACRSAPAAKAALATATPIPPTQVRPTITPTPAHVEKVLDVRYAQDKGVTPSLQSLDIYFGTGQSGCPVLVMIHGGAWFEGDKANPGVALTKAKYFASRGWVLVSINYRLAPLAQFPLPVQDVAQALAWVSDNIAKYGGDPARISLMGHSAGAQLAALVATDERYLKQVGKDLTLIKRVVLLDGAGYDIPHAMQANNDGLQSMYLSEFGSKPETWKDASPVYHIASGKDIPPFLLFYSGATPLKFELSNELFDLLNAAGVPAARAGLPDKSHETINSDIGAPGDWSTDQIYKFLTQ